MDAQSINFTLTTVLSILFGAGGAIGVWFKLKGTVNIQAVKIVSLEEDLKDLKDEKKENNLQMHRRVDALKKVVEKNRENSDNGIQSMTKNMNQMELRIIKAIHEIR